ncbi:MAG: hypothetical protein N2559_02550 [Anaerolineae bacterium]|nr:hypothetical protein [Anaerolineae bacterium]
MPHSSTSSDGQSSRRTRIHLSPNQQLAYGCLAIAVIASLVMYCLGTVSILVRSSFVPRAPTPTLVTPSLLGGATPTQRPATIITLPPGTLLATPTQAPIPTREPPTPTLTPTVEMFGTVPLTNTLVVPASATRVAPTPTRTPTRLVTHTPTPRR